MSPSAAFVAFCRYLAGVRISESSKPSPAKLELESLIASCTPEPNRPAPATIPTDQDQAA